MSVAEVAALSSRDPMKPEQKTLKPEKEGQDSLDTVIRQAIGREPFLSFSRSGESPVQWIQLLHALDQQGSSKVSKGSLPDNGVGGKERSLELYNADSEMNEVKEFVHPSKDNGTATKGSKSTSEHMQALKIPEAVVAFAQAAAKANGEPEKYLPGWPLLSPSKVQLQKCDKCSREFCSSINYRRHIRVHRRSLNIDKDYPKKWEFLGAFWDKLSYDEAKEMVSLTDVAVEEVSGSSIVRALSSLIRNPGFSSLPHMYVRAGAALLDVVQAKAPRFPVSSQELFNLLDDASEKTLLCAGTAVSMQKFMFDGEAGKIALEMKNLIASISFLLEQKLVKAWVADKDAEALRCQKLLVEEEEAAQKRQAELLERKRMKKLRQKEQKAKDLTDVDGKVLSSGTAEATEGISSVGTPEPRAPESDLYAEETSSREPCPQEAAGMVDPEVEANSRLNLCTEDTDQNLDHQVQMGNGRRPLPALRRVPLKPTRAARNGFNSSQVPVPKSSITKHGNYMDPMAVALNNSHKIWTRKIKPENEEEGACDRADREHKEHPVLNDNSEVLIGSISVTLGHDNGHCQDSTSLRSSHYQEKQAKPDSSSSNVNRMAVKLWIPVARHEDGSSTTVNSDERENKMDELSARVAKQIPLNESRVSFDRMNCNGSETCADLSVPMLFSSKAVEAFLAQRWKDAIAADHVKLVLPPETEAADCLDKAEGNNTESQSHSSGCLGRSILGNAENRMAGLGSTEPISGASKLKFRPKPNKNCKLKYVPKQRTNASGE